MPAPHALGWFLAVTFLNGLVVEVGRKMRAPQDEEPGVETYTAMWGRAGATAVWTGAIACNVALATIAAAHVGFARVDLVVFGALALAAAACGSRSCAGARRQRPPHRGDDRRLDASVPTSSSASFRSECTCCDDRSSTPPAAESSFPATPPQRRRTHRRQSAGLVRLRDAGCDVPPWFVVTPDWHDDATDATLDEALAPSTPATHAPVVNT